jgi:Biotin-protein ligase, N terminal
MAHIALYGSAGSPYHHAAVLARAGHGIGFVFPRDIEAGALDGFDAFVMPGSGYLGMAGQLATLGVAGCRTVREYVESGGMYIGSCAGAYDAATVSDRFQAAWPAQADLRLLDDRVWNDAEDNDGLRSPGIGEIVCETADADHPVMAGLPRRFPITHYNGPLFDGPHALARVVGVGASFTAAEEFFGATATKRLIDQAIAVGAASIVAGRRGRGRAVLFGSHPEFGRTLSLDDETGAARLLLNAVSWQLEESGRPQRPPGLLVSEAAIEPDRAEADLASAGPLATRIAERCASLSERTANAGWLDDGTARSAFARSPREIWAMALTAIPTLASEAAGKCETMPDHLRSYRPPAGWPADGGFHGAVPLLQQADKMLAKAETAWTGASPTPAADPYADAHESPYRLVAGSYLAAIGRVASAALLSRMGEENRPRLRASVATVSRRGRRP